MDSEASSSMDNKIFPVPESDLELKRILNSNKYHPGLLKAYKSFENQRSFNTASILLFGLTGVGKSSTINKLFQQEQLAKTGTGASCSSEIAEFELQNLKLERLKLTGAKLKIIDPPGFGDTRGAEFDARTIGTLEEYFKKNKTLKNKYPTAVLVCAKFDDTRYDGESSSFVKMLKGLNSISKYIVDPERPNVILCLTHFMKEKKVNRIDPSKKIDDYLAVVKQFTKFNSIRVVLAENEPEEYDMEKESNGYYKLPNGDYFPYNVYEAMQSMAVDAGDFIGADIIHEAFRGGNNYEIHVGNVTNLLDFKNNAVQDADRAISRIHYNINETQLITQLQRVWDTLPQEVQSLYPGSLLSIQRVLQSHEIFEFSDIPTSKEKLVQVFKGLQSNEVIPKLLSDGLGVRLPKLDITQLVGQCYKVIGFQHIPMTIFQYSPEDSEYNMSPIGFLIPNYIQCDAHRQTKDIFEFLDSKEQYIHTRLRSLGVQGNVSVNAFGGNLDVATTVGYNILDTSDSTYISSSYSCCRLHEMFRLTLKPRNLKLTQDFIDSVNDLPSKFKLEDSSVVQSFKAFLDRYGTHVVQSAYGGGAIELRGTSKLAANIKTSDDKRKLVIDIQAGFKSFFTLDAHTEKNDEATYKESKNTSSVNIEAFLKGGDMKYHSLDLTKLKEDADSTRRGWMESLEYEPIMLVHEMQLVPITEYIKKIDSAKAIEIGLATENLFQASLEYKPSPPPPPRPETEPPSDNGKMGKGCCLKRRTMILMLDKSFKPIDNIVADDIILDKNLEPSRVIGANYVFRNGKHFYGYEGIQPFFTEDHLIVGPNSKHYAASTDIIRNENPLLLNGMNICIMDIGKEYEILKYNQSLHEIKPSKVTLNKEENVDTASDMTWEKIYFLIVDNPSGTYIANDIVCRHEIPDKLENYTKEMAFLYKLLESDVIKSYIQSKARLEMLPIDWIDLDFAVSKWKTMLENVIQSNPKALNQNNFENGTKRSDIDINKYMEIILGSSLWTALSLKLFTALSQILVKTNGQLCDPAFAIYAMDAVLNERKIDVNTMMDPETFTETEENKFHVGVGI